LIDSDEHKTALSPNRSRTSLGWQRSAENARQRRRHARLADSPLENDVSGELPIVETGR